MHTNFFLLSCAVKIWSSLCLHKSFVIFASSCMFITFSSLEIGLLHVPLIFFRRRCDRLIMYVNLTKFTEQEVKQVVWRIAGAVTRIQYYHWYPKLKTAPTTSTTRFTITFCQNYPPQEGPVSLPQTTLWWNHFSILPSEPLSWCEPPPLLPRPPP